MGCFCGGVLGQFVVARQCFGAVCSSSAGVLGLFSGVLWWFRWCFGAVLVVQVPFWDSFCQFRCHFLAVLRQFVTVQVAFCGRFDGSGGVSGPF